MHVYASPIRCSLSACTRRDLPIPASPLSKTICPHPSFTCAQRSRRSWSSCSRPTRGVSPCATLTSNRLWVVSSCRVRTRLDTVEPGGYARFLARCYLHLRLGVPNLVQREMMQSFFPMPASTREESMEPVQRALDGRKPRRVVVVPKRIVNVVS